MKLKRSLQPTTRVIITYSPNIKSKFRFPRWTWDEHDCEANAGQLLGKNKNKHRQIAAESLENDTNHENNRVSKLKLYQYVKGISVSNSKTVERDGRTNRDVKKATTEAKRRSKLQLENGTLSLSLKVNNRFPSIFKLLIILFYSCVYLQNGLVLPSV